MFDQQQRQAEGRRTTLWVVLVLLIVAFFAVPLAIRASSKASSDSSSSDDANYNWPPQSPIDLSSVEAVPCANHSIARSVQIIYGSLSSHKVSLQAAETSQYETWSVDVAKFSWLPTDDDNTPSTNPWWKMRVTRGAEVIDLYPFESHFHFPSEHSVDDMRYSMELHIKHITKETPAQVAVLGLFFTVKYGARNATRDIADPFLDALSSKLVTSRKRVLVGGLETVKLTNADVSLARDLLRTASNAGGGVYMYHGSTTGDKFSKQPVFWHVIGTPAAMSETSYVNLLKGFSTFSQNKQALLASKNQVGPKTATAGPEALWTPNAHGRWSRTSDDRYQPCQTTVTWS